MNELTLSYSLADQSFERTKSLGILNLSAQLAEQLAVDEAFQKFTLFSNFSIAKTINLPRALDTEQFERAANSRLGRITWDQWQCYAAARRSKNRWLFLPKGFASFTCHPPGKLAAYVHDAMHDFYATHFPTAMPPFERWYFRRSLNATLRHADIIFTNTEFTRSEVQRLIKRNGFLQRRVEVAGIGFQSTVGESFAEKPNRVVVLAGSLPHKRSDLAIAWLDRWQRESGFKGEIHIVGGLPKDITAPKNEFWRQHARLSDLEYSELLRSARVLVYFSDYEGFGMPPVEATLGGACAVFSDLPATREVMRDAGQCFFNDSYESFRRAMDSALVVSPQVIEAWSRELQARHSWSHVVQRIVNGLRGVG